MKGEDLEKNEYYQLCSMALNRSIGNICHIEPQHLAAEHYLQCCREIAKKRCYLEVIERELNMSKAAFKRAVGHLLKKQLITVDQHKIRIK